jgi:hypothetical protein
MLDARNEGNICKGVQMDIKDKGPGLNQVNDKVKSNKTRLKDNRKEYENECKVWYIET